MKSLTWWIWNDVLCDVNKYPNFGSIKDNLGVCEGVI